MIKDCENKKINMIITKDTSRLGRDHIEFGFYVERYFPEHGIRYVAVNDGIDTASNSSANDMLVFKSAFNDMYVKDISNKLRSSLNVKKRNGQFVGAYAPYGYNKSDNDKHVLVINEEEATIVKRIFDMFVNGNSLIGARRQVYSQSALEAGKWYDKTPRRIMPGEERPKKGQHEHTKEIYHFLLGDPGMANYSDKVIKGLEPEKIKMLKAWNKEFTSKFEEDELKTVLRLSESIDKL